MDAQVKAVDLGLGVNAQRCDQANDFHEDNRNHQREDADNGQSTQLCRPGAGTEDGDHDGAEDAANTVYGEDVQRVVDLEHVAHMTFTAS